MQLPSTVSGEKLRNNFHTWGHFNPEAVVTSPMGAIENPTGAPNRHPVAVVNGSIANNIDYRQGGVAGNIGTNLFGVNENNSFPRGGTAPGALRPPSPWKDMGQPRSPQGYPPSSRHFGGSSNATLAEELSDPLGANSQKVSGFLYAYGLFRVTGSLKLAPYHRHLRVKFHPQPRPANQGWFCGAVNQAGGSGYVRAVAILGLFAQFDADGWTGASIFTVPAQHLLVGMDESFLGALAYVPVNLWASFTGDDCGPAPRSRNLPLAPLLPSTFDSALTQEDTEANCGYSQAMGCFGHPERNCCARVGNLHGTITKFIIVYDITRFLGNCQDSWEKKNCCARVGIGQRGDKYKKIWKRT